MAVNSSQITQHLAAQAGRERELAQHQPRPARVRIVVDVRGVGETRLQGKKAVDFGALLLDEPTLSSGVVVKTPLRFGELPQCTAMVTGWVRNGNGIYTGANMAFFVDSVRLDIHVQFTLTFEASALRSTLYVSNTVDATANLNTGVVFR